MIKKQLKINEIDQKSQKTSKNDQKTIKKRSKNDQKSSKMIKNDQKTL